MKYAIWAVRFWYAGWMIPAGLEHFYHIYPQPGYDTAKPLAHEMLFALLHSHLFDLVKAIELITGISVLLGIFTPLMLLVCMPVAFCVFWWDSPLSEWNPGSVIAGGRVLAFNVLLSVAYIASYRSMFAVRSEPRALRGSGGTRTAPSPALSRLALIARLSFGAWMLVNGANHFIFSFWPTPGGHEPLSAELMGALVHSHLLDVAMLIELLTGALILAGLFVPAALCMVMPVSTCALYWAILDHQPLSLLFGVAAFALNGLLMLAYLEYYKGALQRTALTLGESGRSMIWDTLFVHPEGRTSRGQFTAALLPLAFVVWCYARSGPNMYAPWDLLVLVYPAVVLHARRLHDMGRSGWLLLVPTVLTVAAMGIWAHRVTLGAQLDLVVPLTALGVFLGFAVWGCVGRGQDEANSFGPPVAA
jgi:uncharacterized membrane protein YhaH (DUF805 family)/uncharacterized membrane protein YphA (DoxX/SURF4 family)